METKVCTKCNQEKSVDQFARRGNSHQARCKSCNNLYAREYRKSKKQNTTPRPIKDNRENFSAIAERIQTLEPRLRLIARSYANDPHQAEDIFQHICEKLLTQADPQDTDSRILVRAKSRAADFINAERTYTFYVGSEKEIAGEETEIDYDAFDFHVSDQRSPEDLLIEAEEAKSITAAINSLSPSNRDIISLLVSGFKQKDIAKKLGVSEPAISQSLKTIAKQLKASNI